ncbi:MAG: MFS transporter [Acidobacteriota bacterium]
MKQIYKFYLTEFLKTQRYFIPIMILFLQFNKLSYTEIFILYTIESFIVFLMEIPSGVLADRIGKRFILILSRSFLIPAYIIFAFADSFILFLPGMIFLALNKAFKSGTHKAYIYDYLAQQKQEVQPSEIFGKAKFWGRLGEASASLIGGFIAVKFGYNIVFLFTLIPSVINIINAISYEKISEEHSTGISGFSPMISHMKRSFKEIRENNIVFKLILNSSIFMICMETAEIYFQPYMVNVEIPLQWFGPIYMTIFILTAIGSRYAYLLEKILSRAAITNLSGWLGIIPLIILGSGLDSKLAVFLFFLIFLLRHMRRPAITTEINRQISSGNRATILSADSLFRSLLKLALLPLIGYLSEIFSIYFSIMILAILLLINQIFFQIPDGKNRKR